MSPLRLWLILNVATLAVLLAGAFTISSLHTQEAVRIAAVNLETLLRVGVAFIDRGDYRGFVESSGLPKDSFSISVSSHSGVFSFPPNANRFPYCAKSFYIRPEGERIEFELCYSGTPVDKFLIWLLVGYVAALFISAFAGQRIEVRAYLAVRDLIRSCGVNVGQAKNLSELLSEMTRISEDAKRARTLEATAAAADAQTRLALRVAHDIRSPLRVIRSLIGGFQSPKLANWDQLQASRLEMAVSRLGGVADGLLEQHRRRKAQVVDLNVVIFDVVAAKKIEFAEMGHSSIQLGLTTTSVDLPVLAECDALSSVLSNLLNNAFEAGPSGDAVISVVTFAEKGRGGIRIVDSGNGFPKEVLEAFEKGLGVSTKAEGHGIGLVSAKEILESFGGSLHLSNGGRGGAVAEVVLPLASGSTIASAGPFASTVTDQILPAEMALVDDDPWVLESWKQAFSDSGLASLSVFSTGEDMIKWAKKASTSTRCFIDYYIGEESGLEVARILSEMGFTDVWITTSLPVTSVQIPPFVSGVIGKTPDFLKNH